MEADATNKTEKELQKKTDNLDAELWENGDGVHPKVIKEHKEKGDIAGKLRGDAEYRCVGTQKSVLLLLNFFHDIIEHGFPNFFALDPFKISQVFRDPSRLN